MNDRVTAPGGDARADACRSPNIPHPQRPLPGLRTDAHQAPARALLGAVIRRFALGERASVALESALALAVLVSGFASLMHIVGDVFAEDWAGRGARAVARALALDPGANPWAALEREGGLDTSAHCPAWTATDTTADCGGWTLTVHRGVSPAQLAAALGDTATADGEMVLVRLEKAQPQDTRNAGTPSTPDGTTRIAAIGVARSEPRG